MKIYLENKGYFQTTQRRIAYIMTLGVQEKYRRLGLASKILNETIKNVEDIYSFINLIILHTKVDNEAGIKFYKKHQFVIGERIKAYYHINNKEEDAFRFEFEKKKEGFKKENVSCFSLIFQCFYNLIFVFLFNGKRFYTVVDENQKII
jgi:RimJ/RimL family protein N-acetyltransferase